MLNSSNQIVAANDYDCWGYPLENRSYQSDDIDYKFTGKQRDAETGYDYFGARYYDARIANWSSVDPLFEKHIGWNPYNYVLRNPMALIDPDGRQLVVTGGRKDNNDINSFYDLLNIKGLEYNNGKATFSGNYAKLETDEKMIIDLIRGNSYDFSTINMLKGSPTRITVNAKLLEKDYITKENDDEKYLTPGESYGGVKYNRASAIATQYFHLGIIEELNIMGAYSDEKIVRHGIIEAIFGARNGGVYEDAHSMASKIAPSDPIDPYTGIGNIGTDIYVTTRKGKPELVYECNFK